MDSSGAGFDFVVVGHVTIDVTPAGRLAGGVATYAAAIAAGLGRRVAVVTSMAGEPDAADAAAGVTIFRVHSQTTTVMEHYQDGGRRIQYLRSRAASISASDIPEGPRRAPIALLGPVIGEVEPSVAAAFGGALVGATAQGWLRRVAPDGRVWDGNVGGLELRALAGRLTLLVLSEEDLAGARLPAAWTEAFPIVVVTRAEAGLDCFHSGRCEHLPAFPAVERDATGAGDALATAFLIRLAETQRVEDAARFGAAAASFAVEVEGIDAMPDRRQVEERMRDHPEVRFKRCP